MQRNIVVVLSEKKEQGVCRKGSPQWIEKEDIVSLWPEALRHFSPKRIRKTMQQESMLRWEEYMGEQHPNPLVAIQSWVAVREKLWNPEEEQILTLRKWLKKIEPACRIEAKEIRKKMQEQQNHLPFLPSKKSLHRALDTKIRIVLHRGYVHGKLTRRRIREKGFICWRGAKSKGLRGTDVAPFVSPREQPPDVVLHILKYAWNTDPIRAFEALQILGCLKEVHLHTELSVEAHSAVPKQDLYRILGTKEGWVEAGVAGRAHTRAKNLILAGEQVLVHSNPTIAPRKDQHFFAPRNRKNTSLFSLWNRGIRLDDVGRYSLTPENIALNIAKSIKEKVVLDAFCGCGGNAIGFARQLHIQKVIAVDVDKNRLEMAKHNAKIYDVADKIVFYHGDVRKRKNLPSFVFADPPWDYGIEFLEQIQTWVMKTFPAGILKLPVYMPMPMDANIRIICTPEGYPSFLLRYWGNN